MSAISSWNWYCPYCGTRTAQHDFDCQRNSEENRARRKAYGQYTGDGYAIEPEQPESENDG